MKTLKQLLCTMLLLCGLALPSVAQNPAPTTVPYDNNGAYAINLQDLSIVLPVTVRKKSGLIPFNAGGFTAANQFLSAQTHSGHPNFYLGASFTPAPSIVAFPIQLATSRETDITCPDGITPTQMYSNWYVITAEGNTHVIVPTSTNTFVDKKKVVNGASCEYSSMTGVTQDGSNLTLVVTVNPDTAAVYGPSGDKVVATAVSGASLQFHWNTYQDSNNNTIALAQGVTSSYTDSLGVDALDISASGISWKDVNGGTQQYVDTTTPYYGATAFACPSPYQDWTNAIQSNYLTNVAYANGTSLAISYEIPSGFSSSYTTGRIVQLNLPTGGVVNFTYGAFNCSDGMSDVLKKITTDGTWTYTYSSSTGSTTVVDPAGNNTVYTFLLGQDGKTHYLSSKVVYQGSSTVLTTETYAYTPMVSGEVGLPIAQIDHYTKLGTMTTSNDVRETFDSTGNVLTISQMDFGQTQPAFTVTTTYGTFVSGTGCVAFSNQYIKKPCEVSAADAAGNLISDTRVTYDAKGNATKTYTWNGSSYLTATASYNSTGTLSSSTSISGVASSFIYGNCNGAFPTTSTIGPLTSHATWDCNGGVQLTATNPNGGITQYGYETAGGTADPMWRLSSVKDPAGITTYTTYSQNAVESTANFGASVEDSVTSTDAFGRTIRKQTKQGSSYNTVSTPYHVNLETILNSVPCLAPLGSDCSGGFTSSILDGAGRVKSVLGADGKTLNTTFTKQDVTTILSAPAGENNKSSQIEMDGLGRVVSYCDIMASGGSTCGQVAGGSGVLTSYSYTTAVGLITTTATRGSEAKVIKKDASGRVIYSSTPEKGAMSFYYDAPLSGDCYSLAAPGLLNETVDNAGVKTCYYYDNHFGSMRIISIQAGFGSSSDMCRNFIYDSIANATYSGNTPPAGYVASNTVGRLIEAQTNTHCNLPTVTDEWFAYDADGRVTDVWESTPHSGGYFHTIVTYSGNGLPLSLSGIPGYPSFTFDLDADGAWNTAKEGTVALVSGVARGAVGPTNISIGSGTDEDVYTYSVSSGYMSSYQFFVGSANTQGIFTWNQDGQLGTLAITDGFNAGGTQTCTFGYDDLARIASDSCTGTAGWGQTFTYDQYNNITKAGSSAWNPGYNTKNQYALVGATYDANGDVTYDGVQHYTWDLFGQMASSAGNPPTCGTSGVCYIYDALGRMVEKSNAAVYTEILYSPLGKSAEVSGGTTTYAYVALPGGGTGYFTGATGTNRMYQHTDWLGSARVMSSIPGTGNGTVNYDRAFAPYGEKYASFGPGTALTNFTGDTQEFNTWLSDTPNRELNNGQGRWESPDPAGAGWNAYAYGTDPNSSVDHSGLQMLNLHQGVGMLNSPDFGDLEGWSDAQFTVGANAEAYAAYEAMVGTTFAAASTATSIGGPNDVIGGGVGGTHPNDNAGPPRTGALPRGVVVSTVDFSFMDTLRFAMGEGWPETKQALDNMNYSLQIVGASKGYSNVEPEISNYEEVTSTVRALTAGEEGSLDFMGPYVSNNTKGLVTEQSMTNEQMSLFEVEGFVTSENVPGFIARRSDGLGPLSQPSIRFTAPYVVRETTGNALNVVQLNRNGVLSVPGIPQQLTLPWAIHLVGQ